jgi:hypothetical protein
MVESENYMYHQKMVESENYMYHQKMVESENYMYHQKMVESENYMYHQTIRPSDHQAIRKSCAVKVGEQNQGQLDSLNVARHGPISICHGRLWMMI